jgi:hypothetical protein
LESIETNDLTRILPVTIAAERWKNAVWNHLCRWRSFFLGANGTRLDGRRNGSVVAGFEGAGAAMIPSGGQVWIATGHTDMRRGMQSLALQVPESLHRTLTLAISTSSQVVAVTWPRSSGTVELDCRFTPSAWTAGGLFGHRHGRRGIDLGGADGLHAGRDRLAKSATDLAAQECWVSDKISARMHFSSPQITEFVILLLHGC